jgi:hypothetical protein
MAQRFLRGKHDAECHNLHPGGQNADGRRARKPDRPMRRALHEYSPGVAGERAFIYAPVRHGRGHPVFADIRYRLAAARTPPVMERFMDELDDALGAATGFAARIRCFGYAAPNIYARN